MLYSRLGSTQKLGHFEGISHPYAGLGGIFDELSRVTGYRKISKEQQYQQMQASQQARADAEKAEKQAQRDAALAREDAIKAEAQAREDAERDRALAKKQDELDYQRQLKENEMKLAQDKIALEAKKLADAAAHKRDIETAQLNLDQERIKAKTASAQSATRAETTKIVIIVGAVLAAVTVLAVLVAK